MTVRLCPRDRAGVLAVLIVLSLTPSTYADLRPAPFTNKGTQPTVTFPIIGSGDCKGCHGEYDDTNNIEPWDTWAGSMMAQAARDPLFWAALDVANHDLPGIGDWCLRCHAPGPWLAGRSENNDQTDGCGFQGNLDAAGGDFDGVTCHACHRMMVNPAPPEGQQPFYLGNADFWIDDGTCNGQGEPCRRGPYDYVASGGVPPEPSEHYWAYSPYHVSSDICGNCHNVTSPAVDLVDQDGSSTGLKYPIERTYKEWKSSSFSDATNGTTCQGCHMVDATVDSAYACYQKLNNHTADLPIHRLAGGNAWIPSVLKTIYPALGLSANFDATRNFALEMLQDKSAEIDVTAANEVVDGKIAVSVKVTNLTGHKLPTGYGEGRRMWLRVTARDAAGALLFESGRYVDSTGVLIPDPQITVYEVKQGIWDSTATECTVADSAGVAHFHFVRNNCIRKDNRIPPLGFSGKDDKEIQPIPVGYYPETSSGSGILVNYDVRPYQVPFPPGTQGPVHVTAELLYQTSSREYIDFLKEQAATHGFPNDCIPRSGGALGKSRGAYMHDLWTQHGRSAPVVMKTGQATSTVGQAFAVAAPEAPPGSIRMVTRSAPNESVQRVAYDLPTGMPIRLTVYNVAGRAIRTIVNAWQPAGTHEARWNAAREADGVYFLRLEAGSSVFVRRVVVVR